MAAFIIYIIRWAVCLTLLYSLFGVFLKHDTLHAFNRIVLLFVLAASMTLPFVQISTKDATMVTQGREKIEHQITNMQNVDFASLTMQAEKQGERGYTDAETAFTQRSVTNAQLIIITLVLIYIIGLAIYWLRYIWQIISLLLLIHKSSEVNVEDIPGYVHVVTNTNVKSPCSWMTWIILQPDDVNNRAIINHELAHIRLGHSWDMLLCELTCRMLWFLPFAWMLRQDLRDIHEYQADRSVLQSGIKDEEYQLLLIRKATSTGLQPVVNAFNQSPIKRRFKMMYRKPSKRWVALKAAYLLPLSAIAVVAFARPQAMSEIEEKVEATVPTITEAAKAVAQQITSPVNKWAEEETDASAQAVDNGMKESIAAFLPTFSATELPDSNLVRADLGDSKKREVLPFNSQNSKELVDSVMQAVGARKIADGTYIGHFQPSLNGDTVRLSNVQFRDKQSNVVASIDFSQNKSNPFAYNLTLQAGTRKNEKGFYIRYLQPANSSVRNYDQPKNDPNVVLSMDSVITKNSPLSWPGRPSAIERTKKETRVFMYVWSRSPEQEAIFRQSGERSVFKYYVIHDEDTGDTYKFRYSDNSYLKLLGQKRANTSDCDNAPYNVYQVCLVFPPLGKKVSKISIYNETTPKEYRFSPIWLKDIPHKPNIITH